MMMFSLFSFSWFGQAVRSGRERRQSLPARLRSRNLSLESLEERTLLSIWSTVTLTPAPIARGFLAGVTAGDGRIYGIGGGPTVFTSSNVGTVEAGNVFSGVLQARASLPTPTASLAAAVGGDGKIY